MLLPILALLTFADLTGPSGPHSRQDVITTVATVNAVALVASARCPDILVNTDIDQLQSALGLADADKKEAFAQTVSLAKTYAKQVDDVEGMVGRELFRAAKDQEPRAVRLTSR